MKMILFTLLIPFTLKATCLPQKAIDSLDTRHYYHFWLKEKDEMKVQRYLNELHKFRATHYGYIPSQPVTRSYNKEPNTKFITETSFMGMKVKLHSKILAPLKCVEEEIQKSCQVNGNDYIPKTVSGYRERDSYARVISNHQFGIAIDFDPLNDHSHDNGNPCCGPSCKESWRTHPICKGHDTSHNSPYNVAKINPCWVKSFEKYGFHWLINFRMHDTMHFEYLADPTEL